MKKAYELRERVSEREKFYISSHYDIFVTGDLLKANRVFDLWAQTYPRDTVPAVDLSSVYTELGWYDSALANARRALALDPSSALNYVNLAFSYISVGRLDEAAAIIQQAKAHRVELTPHYYVYRVAFLQGDPVGMAREAAWAAARPDTDRFFQMESDTASYAGQMAKANGLTTHAISVAEQTGAKETAAGYQAESALREAVVGDDTQARAQATGALRLSNGRDTEAASALGLALAGDPSQARKLASDLAQHFPEDTVVQFNYLPTIHAAIALDEKAPAKAIADLQPASPYELGTPAAAISLNLYPVYVRGLTYLAAHQGAQAAAQFRIILDHPGIVQNEVIGSLAHLGLARARVLSGDKPGARKQYQDFLALWQHADPTIPVLDQAKSEYDKLQ